MIKLKINYLSLSYSSLIGPCDIQSEWNLLICVAIAACMHIHCWYNLQWLWVEVVLTRSVVLSWRPMSPVRIECYWVSSFRKPASRHWTVTMWGQQMQQQWHNPTVLEPISKAWPLRGGHHLALMGLLILGKPHGVHACIRIQSSNYICTTDTVLYGCMQHTLFVRALLQT
jgi:hypothetical protein